MKPIHVYARIESATGGAVTAAELLAHLIPHGYALVRQEGGEHESAPAQVEGVVEQPVVEVAP